MTLKYYACVRAKSCLVFLEETNPKSYIKFILTKLFRKLTEEEEKL
jgi:hypothetical protein